MPGPIDAAYRNMVNASTQTSGRAGKVVAREEMAAIKAVLDAKRGGISDGDRMKVWRDFRGQTLDAGARRIYNQILRFQPPPIDPPIVALYAVAINDAARSGDAVRMRVMAETARTALKHAGPSGGGARVAAMSASSAGSAGAGNVEAVRTALTRLNAAIRAL